MSTREEIEALGFEVPDSIEPVVAYRSWFLGSTSLHSHNMTLWAPGAPMGAGCMYKRFTPDHKTSPVRSCSCGIYAAKKDKADVIVPKLPNSVYGEVYLWGKIVEAGGGYRAQYAYPKRFFVPDENTKKRVEGLGFGVPVEIVEGVMPYAFPFPKGETPTLHRAFRRTGQLYPFIPALPWLVLGVVDSFTLDLGQAFNQVLVAVMFIFGVAMGLLSFHLRRTIRRLYQ